MGTTVGLAETAPTVLFQDLFEGQPGTLPTTPPWTNVNSDANPDHESVLRLDTVDRFAQGTGNRYLEFRDSSESGSLQLSVFQAFNEEVVTLSFRFYEPFEPEYLDQLSIQLFAGTGTRVAGNRAQVLRLRNGRIPMVEGDEIVYGYHVPRRIDFVVNNSAATIEYNGNQSLASGFADLWLDGALAAPGYTFARQAGPGPIRSLDISTFSNHNQRIFLDDIVVFSGAVVGAPLDTDPPPPAPVQATFPLRLEPGRMVSELFGYVPEYTQNVPSFDNMNRPYIRSRTKDYDHTSFVHTWRDGAWEERDFLGAIQEAVPAFDSFHRGAGWFTDRVVFDSEDRAYTILNVNLSPSGNRNLLLFSEDFGESWEVHPLSNGGIFAIEHAAGYNEIDGPPFLLLLRRRAAAHPDTWASYNQFHYLHPRIENGGLIIPSYTETHINNDLISLSQHSGGSPFSATKDGLTHIVWIEVTNEDVPGTPTFAATYDHATQVLGEPVLLAYAPPKNNSHNRPGIVIDSAGYLHVVTGSHHGQNFYYTRSLQPNDVYSGWTEPEAVWGSGWIAVNGENRGGQTYVSLVCDPDDTLHLVFRHWRYPDEYFNRSGYNRYAGLAYQRKPKDGVWSEPRLLVAPERGDYAIYYQKLAIDRIGRLFLSFSYFDWVLYEQRPESERYWRRMVVVSDDSGETWRLAENRDFDDRWSLTPFNKWRFQHFSNHQIRERANTRKSDAPAADGVPNAIKFLLGLSPWHDERGNLPQPFLDGGRLVFDFSIPEKTGEIAYAVETSPDLKDWRSGPDIIELIERSRSDGRIYLRARTTEEAESPHRRFLRLRAIHPEVD